MTRYKLAVYGLCFGLGLITHAWLGAQYTNSIAHTLDRPQFVYGVAVDATNNADAVAWCIKDDNCIDIYDVSDLPRRNDVTTSARKRFEECSRAHEAGTDIYFSCLTGDNF